MQVSQAGLMELIGHEAIVLTRYRDSAGIWTIGIGHTASAGPPAPAGFEGRMSIESAIALFRRDIERYETAVRAALRVPVTQAEFDALVSFHFNTGAIARAALVKSLNAGDRGRATREFLNWRRPPEILARRRKEQQLFETGAYSNGGRASLIEADRTGRVLFSTARSIDLHPYLGARNISAGGIAPAGR